ncbi:hypothetical protein NL676_031830 [Syzygium grande]|nr:hypothetical protein NL676_031830 [Syzygium grande]
MRSICRTESNSAPDPFVLRSANPIDFMVELSLQKEPPRVDDVTLLGHWDHGFWSVGPLKSGLFLEFEVNG